MPVKLPYFGKGPVPVKKANAYEDSPPVTLSHNNEWGCTRPGVSGVPPSGLGGSLPHVLVAALSSALVGRQED